MDAAAGGALTCTAMNCMTRLKRRVFLSLLLIAVVANAAPRISVGLGYYTILPNKLLLASTVTGESTNGLDCLWTKESGPGEVKFERPTATTTWATATMPGQYVFKLKATDGSASAEATTTVNVYPPRRFGNPILPGMFPDPHVMFDEGHFLHLRHLDGKRRRLLRPRLGLDVGRFRELGDEAHQLAGIRQIRRRHLGARHHPQGRQILSVHHPLRRLRHLDRRGRLTRRARGKTCARTTPPIVSGGGKAGRIVAAYNMDSQPFIDDDGQAYMYWGWSEAMAAKLTPDLKNIDGEVHFLKGTKWLPNGGELPQWFSVDLGESMPRHQDRHLARVQARRLRLQDRGFRRRTSTGACSPTARPTAPRTARRRLRGRGQGTGRHVRITFNHCGGHWAGLYNFAVYSGDKLVSLRQARHRLIRSRQRLGTGKRGGRVQRPVHLADFVEGSYMIKHNGTYYLLYSSGALHDGSYSVHYAMAKHPFGPFTTPPEPHHAQDERGADHPAAPATTRCSSSRANTTSSITSTTSRTKAARCVFRQTCADLMEFNPDGTIKPVVPTQTGVGPLQPLVPQGNDLARGQYATATSVKSGFYVPEYALDHNNASLWRAANNTYPQSLTVDLGGTSERCPDRNQLRIPHAFLQILPSKPRSTASAWTTVADKHADFPVAVSPHRDAGQARARFVRITITGCQRPENGAGIYTLKVFQR